MLKNPNFSKFSDFTPLLPPPPSKSKISKISKIDFEYSSLVYSCQIFLHWSNVKPIMFENEKVFEI